MGRRVVEKKSRQTEKAIVETVPRSVSIGSAGRKTKELLLC